MTFEAKFCASLCLIAVVGAVVGGHAPTPVEQCHERAMVVRPSWEVHTLDCPVGSTLEASGMEGDWFVVCSCGNATIHRWRPGEMDGGL